MSRTYRRKNSKPDYYTWEYTKDYCIVKVPITDKKRIKYIKAKYHSDHGSNITYWISTPGHWIHDMMEVPFRAKCKVLLNNIKKLQYYEDAPEFPPYNKPHIYYW